MPWNDPDDPRASSWRDAYELTMGTYGVLLLVLGVLLGGLGLIVLAVVLFSWHPLAGLAYLGLGVAVAVALSIRDRRRNPTVS